MAQLPNLDDLALLGIAREDGRKFPATRAVLKGRCGGRLALRDRCVSEKIVKMLLEIPSGLRFAELEIGCTHNRLPPSAVRLAEAYGKTLAKLTHTVSLNCESYPFPSLVGSSVKH